MEYVFGTRNEKEILKTKSDTHTDLTGYHSIERVYPDQTITDNFRIVNKIHSKEDVGGNCYDWYVIDHHYRMTDKTGSLAEKVTETSAAIENALCEQDVTMDERMSALEDAICELDAIINK